jgi:excisionase family DNA binding protein
VAKLGYEPQSPPPLPRLWCGSISFQTGNMNLANLYTPEEVAKRLKVSRRAVYQWLTTGKLVGMKAGQGWRITEEDLIAFMKSNASRELDSKSGKESE